MEKNNLVSVSKSIFFLAASLALIPLALTFFGQYGQGGWYKNIRAEVTNQPYARTVSVSGEGKVSVKPDLAKVSLSVVSSAKKVSDVTKDGNVKMTQVIDGLKALGIEAKDIRTSEYNLYPQYDYERPMYDKSGLPPIVGYNLTQSVEVKIRDLAKVDDVLDKALALGTNQVGQLQFDLDDASNVKKEAREKAFAAAREKAEAMAKAAGVRIGRVVTFNEDYAPVMPYMYANFAYDAKAGAEMSVAPSVEAGSKELAVNVSVTYEID